MDAYEGTYLGGILVMDEWEEIDGSWYRFGKSGAMLTGWLWEDDAWYYLKPSGAMAEDEWEKVNGKWYLFDEDGKMLTGWQTDNGKYYYLADSGTMVTGRLIIDGEIYVFDASGALVSTG